MTRYFTSSDSIVTSRRRVEIQSTSEMSPRPSVINFLLHTLLAQLNAYQVFRRVFNLFNHFNDGGYDYVI